MSRPRDITSNEVLRSMRHMAWERAKEGLNSVSATFWDREERHEKFMDMVKEFITHIEDHGLAE